MKEKFEALKNEIKSLLDAAESLINEGKFDEAKTKQEEAASKREQLVVIKAQLDAQENDQMEALKAENAALKAAAEQPKRLPFEKTDTVDTTDETADAMKSFTVLKYGTSEPAVQAVIKDIYGSSTDYNSRRLQQMDAFVKYVRLGERYLSLDEMNVIKAGPARNMLLQPDVLKAEIAAGRSVAEIKATLEEGSNTLGGFLVPEDYRAEIIKRLMGQVVVRGRARVVTTTRDAVEWPKLEGGNSQYTSAVRVTWVDETPANANVAQTNPTWGLTRIPIHTVMARTDLSRNLLEDSAFNLLDVMADLFAEAMAIDEDTQFLTGQGAGTPYGVLGDRSSGTNETPVTGVTVSNSGDASQVTADGLINLVYSIDSQYRNGAIFVMARNSQRDVRKLKDGEARYLWQPGLIAGQPASLLGYSVFESQSMPAIAANNHPIMFGDFRLGYVIADRVGMSVERVQDTTTTGTNTVALFARRRLGGQVVAPWAFAAQKIST